MLHPRLLTEACRLRKILAVARDAGLSLKGVPHFIEENATARQSVVQCVCVGRLVVVRARLKVSLRGLLIWSGGGRCWLPWQRARPGRGAQAHWDRRGSRGSREADRCRAAPAS